MELELRASASFRWMDCTASATIDVSHLAPSKSDASASLGTALHAVSQTCLEEGSSPRRYIGSLFNDVEISRKHTEEVTVPYVEFVRERAKGRKMYVEKKVEFNAHIGGTPDVVIIDPSYIEVVDLKTGVKKVSVIGNTQLMIYLLSVYEKYYCIYEFEKFAITIFQPYANNIVTHWLSVNDLLKFKAELLDVYQRILNLDVKFSPSSHNCFYCPAAAICPALHEKATEMAKLDFIPKNLSGEELAMKLELIEILIPYIAAVKEEARHRLQHRIKVPGFKLHPGNSKNEWIDPRKTIMALRKVGLDGYFTDPVLRSPSQIKELVKQQHVDIDLDDYISTTSQEPYVVRDRGTRDDDQTESAVNDFSEVVNNAQTTKRRAR